MRLLLQLRYGVLALGAGTITGLTLPAVLLTVPAAVAPRAEAHAEGELGGARRESSRKSHSAPSRLPSTRRFDITFWNIHTRELLPVPVAGLPSEAELSRFLRCRITGEESRMSPVPFAVATHLARREGRQRVHVVSGYRSRKLNALLRKKGRDVADASHHMLGGALDFRIPGVPLGRLAAYLEETHEGGVGRYLESNFVHVDDGPRRRWRGR